MTRTERVEHLLRAAASAVLTLPLVGCSTLQSRQTANGFPDENRAVPVRIEPVAANGDIRLPNRRDPGEVVNLARNLSETGRHREAAAIYLDAAGRFRSVDGRFEEDCRKSAVREYWLGGEAAKARALLDDIETSQDIYARAAEDGSIRRLRALLSAADETAAP